MRWIRLTPKIGPNIIFNTRNIAYIAEPAQELQERGVGACIMLIGSTQNVIPVEEDWLKVASAINRKELTES